MTLRLIGIVGSMRKGGNTEAAVQGVLAGAAEAAGVEAEVVCLRDYRIEFCRGCYEIHGREGNPCAIHDDVGLLLPKLVTADAIVFGSPAYFGGLSGLLRSFFDRMGPVWGKLEGKSAGIVAVGEDRFGGQELVAESIAIFCRAFRLQVVGWPLCLQTPSGDKAGSLAGDANAMQLTAQLGMKIVQELERKGSRGS